jgi:tetratricopeptide (TPR) repeat protein
MGAPDNAFLLRAQGLEALREHHDATAADLLSRYLDSNPNDREAEVALAVARTGQGRYGAALAIFDRHLEREPRSPLLHYNRAMTLERMGKKADAVTAYEQVLWLMPDHAKARERLDALNGAKPKPRPTATAAAPAAPSPAKAPYSPASPPAKMTNPPARPTAVNEEDIPVVIAVEDDEAVEVVAVAAERLGKKERWIHPAWLVGISVFVAVLIGVAVYTMSAYQAGGYAAGATFCALMLLAGIQAVHRGRRGDKRYPLPLGYVLLGLGALGLFNVSAFTAYYLTAVDWQEAKRIRQQQALMEELRHPKPRKLTAEEIAKAKEQSEQRQREFRSKQVRDHLEYLKGNDPSKLLFGVMHFSGSSPEQGDPKEEVATLLEAALSQKDVSVRIWAAKALKSWGSKNSIAKLRPLLSDRNIVLRRAAKEAIDALEKLP